MKIEFFKRIWGGWVSGSCVQFAGRAGRNLPAGWTSDGQLLRGVEANIGKLGGVMPRV